jgi:hypothetical protein
MLAQELYEGLKNLLEQHYNQPLTHLQLQPVGGGSINQTGKLTFQTTMPSAKSTMQSGFHTCS